jgi:hypothetical protein
MNDTIASSRFLSQTGKRLSIGFVLLCITLLGARAAYMQHAALTRPKSARMWPMEVARRAVQLSSTLGGASRLTATPIYLEERVRYHRRIPALRSLWQTHCLVNGRRFDLIFNDATGGLVCVLGADRVEMDHPEPSHLAPIDSPGAAIEASLQRLKDLQMLPPGTRVRLAGSPQKVRVGGGWEVVWRALRPGVPQASDIRVVLDRRGGAPLEVDDDYQLNRLTAL